MKKLLLFIITLMLFVLSGCVESTKEFSFEEESIKLQLNEVKPLPLKLTNLSLKDLSFSFSNEGIIDISGDAIIPLNIGTTTVTATYDNQTDSIVVEVTPILPSLEVVMDVLEIGQTVKLNLTNYNHEDFNWEVSNPEIIELASNFIIKALEIGTSTITATHKTDPLIKNTITIEVIPYRPVLSASINVLRVGDKSQMVITNLDMTGYSQEDYNWEISDESIISLDENYIVTGLKLGEATIKISLKNNPKSFRTYSFKVVEPTDKKTPLNEPAEGPLIIELENVQGLVQAGESFEVNIVGGNSLYNYHWLVDDMSIARVTENGLVLGAKAGRTKVYVESKEKTKDGKPLTRGEFTITVEGTPNVDYRNRIVEIGLAEEGYVEEGPDNENKYGVWYQYENVAWCAIFVSWCANEAGIGTDIITRYCLCSEAVRWFQKQGNYKFRGEYEPITGDIIFFQSGGNISHTGIVVDCDGTYVYTIEGNTSNSVRQRTYRLTDTYIHGYGVPNYPEYNPEK
ncbi:MAG TPA: CHAP domain-containing protein [Acholeplasmataceae bacterium]|nr:CHAP domain-containing protein [Acholeplasmataceae bacterium]